jgi:NitT/TauT family transport system ATP-binding protein
MVNRNIHVSDFVLECRKVSHWFDRQKVLYDINLQISRGQFVGLVGASGCGKSTLLRAMLGTHPPRAGQVLMNGAAVCRPGRERGIVYQRYTLFPFLTALENVAFGPMLDQVGICGRLLGPWKWRTRRKAHLELAEERLTALGLKDALHQYPAQLSGGMCQRVAIAQALIMQPEILLLDEPFGALDEATREEQQAMLLSLRDENRRAQEKGERPPYTLVLVTHELNEAIYVADRVVSLSRHWLWEKEPELTEHPGATVVYDAATPLSPRDPHSKFADFQAQRAEIRQAAFVAPGHCRNQFVRYWKGCPSGQSGRAPAEDRAAPLSPR